MVDEEVSSGIIGRENARHNIPFSTHNPFSVLSLCVSFRDYISVFELFTASSKHAQTLPVKAVIRFERDALPVCFSL